MTDLIDKKEITLEGRQYILSKFPAVEGREIIVKYGISSIPKVGDYVINEAMMYKTLSYVAVDIDGNEQRLINKTLINNYVPNWELLIKLEAEMLTYNCSFFQNGRVSTFLKDFAQKAPQWITKILTDSLAQLSQKNEQRSEN